MRKVMFGLSLSVIVVITILIVISMDSRSIRTQEIENGLSQAMESSVNSLLLKDSYSITDRDKFIADLLQSLLLQIDSDSDITVNILNCDIDKGIITVEATENYYYPNGNIGTVSSIKTVILEQPHTVAAQVEAEMYTIVFLLQDNEGNIEIYKEYRLEKNTNIIIPPNPTMEGKTFKHWKTSSGTAVTLDGLQITSDMELTAVFE